MTDTRSSSALFKRAEQLKRWEESDTNKQSALPKRASRIQFSSGIVFLAACTAGDKDEVQRLLKAGADINTANVDGLTALHQACIDDNLDMVEFLVTHGADVNRGDNEGWTALHATASCGFLSIARYLLENGADVGAVNYDGELAIDIAESDAMEDLLQKAIDEKGVDCEKSRSAEVDSLLADAKGWAASGYVEVRDPKTGGAPLHVAAAKGYLDVARTLLEQCGVEPDCVDYEGWTPLHAAALWGQRDACALLLKHGADPHLTNYSGQTCMDLVDPSISAWLADAATKASRRINNNNNNKRRRSPPAPAPDVKRVELQITGQDTVINDKPVEIIPKSVEKPPKGRAPSPEGEPADAGNDDAPSWRRSASFRNRQTDTARENNKPANNTATTDNDTILRRTHSFENDKTFYQRYRDVTARIKASSCPSLPPLPATLPAPAATPAPPAHIDRVLPERRERDANTWAPGTTPPAAAPASPTHTTAQTTVRSGEGAGAAGSGGESLSTSNSSESTPSAATPTKLSPGNIFKNFFKSFVPPVRDEESETQRKAHAKRVRETRRSTQGVTLDEIKSAEQLVKKKAGNGMVEPPAPAITPASTPAAPAPAPASKKQDDSVATTNDNSGGQRAVGEAAPAGPAASATIAANSERRPSWRLRLDPANKFELEDASLTPERTATAALTVTTGATTVTSNAEATVTIPLRRPPSGSTANTSAPASSPHKDDSRAEEDEDSEGEEEREGGPESKSSSASPASTQAALNVIQRRRRPKRRSTGVGHVDMDDIVNDRGGAADGDADTDATAQSGSERGERARTEEGEEGARDYKAMYEASQAEVRRLRGLLHTSEQQLRDVRATITCLTQNQSQNSMRLFDRSSQSSLSELEKRERRAMERKLSEMEEELKQLQKLKAENERLRAENRALTRVVSKLTNSAAK